MVTRTQLDRLTSRIERLGATLDPDPILGVPLYEGETEPEALAAFEEQFGPMPPGMRVEFNRSNRTRAVGMQSALHSILCLGPEELTAMFKDIDGKTRGVPNQYRQRSAPKPNETE